MFCKRTQSSFTKTIRLRHMNDFHCCKNDNIYFWCVLIPSSCDSKWFVIQQHIICSVKAGTQQTLEEIVSYFTFFGWFHIQLTLSSVIDCYCSRYLNDNQIKALPKDFFSRTHSLVFLYLQHNRMEDFDLHLFKHLNSLRWLDLSENFLSLHKQTFPNLTRLNDL